LKPVNRLVTMTAKLDRPGRAIDVRMLSATWMEDLSSRGGKIVIEPVTPARLDDIAAAHDLTAVAAGRGDLCNLFARNAERSVYDKPQRKLTLIITRGAPMQIDRVPFLPVRFNLTAGVGEAFWVPYLHKSGEHTWNLLFEAKPAGPMDRFDECKTGDECVAMAKKVIAELAPWDSAFAEPMTLADERGWLKGGVAPTVRAPVAKLPSGRAVTAIGDTIISLDPIAGQGANCGTRQARNFVACVDAHQDGPLDEAWMTSTFEQFWREQGQHIVRFNNLLLEPISGAGRLLLVSQYGSDGVHDNVQQRIANRFANNFDDTSRYTEALVRDAASKQLIAESGGSFPWSFARGLAGVARGQVRQTLGMQPRHPAHW
jgi:hypothetical protein